VTAVEVLQPLLGGTESFAVTGATGWFGRATLDLLDQLLGVAAARRVTAYASSPRSVTTTLGRPVEIRPLNELPGQSPAPTHLLHFACLTRDRLPAMGADAYIAANLQISMLVLEAVQRSNPAGLVLTSSGAAYTADRGLTTDLRGNPYGALKHLDELLLCAAVEAGGGSTAVARVFSVGGAGITKSDLYALGDLIAMAQRGGPLEVRASRPVVRSYAAVDDVVALALWSVLRGESVVFDSGGDIVEVGELARAVAEAHGLPPSVVVRRSDPEAAEDRYVGDPSAWQALVRRSGLIPRGLPALIRETSSWMSGARTS
jgi:UDP-glucuronate decarboxylase